LLEVTVAPRAAKAAALRGGKEKDFANIGLFSAYFKDVWDENI